MDWYGMIDTFYKSGSWSSEQVGDAVTMGKISDNQYKEITGEDYSI